MTPAEYDEVKELLTIQEEQITALDETSKRLTEILTND